MTKAQDYVAREDISKYADEMALSIISDLSDDQFELVLKVGQEVSSGMEPGIDYSVTRVNEDVGNFENSRKTFWKECRRARVQDGYAIYEGVQINKGDRRRDFAVIEIGEGRSVVVE